MTLTPLKWVLGRDIEKPSLSNQYLHLFHARKYYACHAIKGRGNMAKRSSSEQGIGGRAISMPQSSLLQSQRLKIYKNDTNTSFIDYQPDQSEWKYTLLFLLQLDERKFKANAKDDRRLSRHLWLHLWFQKSGGFTRPKCNHLQPTLLAIILTHEWILNLPKLSY